MAAFEIHPYEMNPTLLNNTGWQGNGRTAFAVTLVFFNHSTSRALLGE